MIFVLGRDVGGASEAYSSFLFSSGGGLMGEFGVWVFGRGILLSLTLIRLHIPIVILSLFLAGAWVCTTKHSS